MPRAEIDSRNYSPLNGGVIVLLCSSGEDLNVLESEHVSEGTIYCTVSISGTTTACEIRDLLVVYNNVNTYTSLRKP